MVDEKKVRDMVRSVVLRTLGNQDPGKPAAARSAGGRLVSEADLRDLPAGSMFEIAPDALVTPLAAQIAMERHIRLERRSVGAAASALTSGSMAPASKAAGSGSSKKVVALGADHGGVGMKDSLIETVRKLGFEAIDCGTSGKEAVDYPDFALAVAQLVGQGRAWRGIVVDGAGIGSCMAANKVPGVRAAMCYDQATAVNSREHNDANVLTLGAGLIGQNLAEQIVSTWLGTEFGGGRHARRVNKIVDIEKRFLK